MTRNTIRELNRGHEDIALPYVLDIVWYATQADRFGKSRKLPMTGKGGGPGG